MDGETRCRVSGRGEQFLRLNDVSRRGVLRKCRLRVQKLLTTGCGGTRCGDGGGRGAGLVGAARGLVGVVSNFCALTTFPEGASCGNAGLGYKNCSHQGARHQALGTRRQNTSPVRYLP
ncbi:hypothetical protein CIP100294_01912 [Corynebacterium diphtheriae]|nr:hypothetical protein CIP100294_01912 [Corynebacterium diphtheriae]